MYKKGQSGNPGGRPKEEREFVAACREKSLEALKIIEECMKQTKHPKLRLQAAIWIAERAHGKAPQSLEVGGKDGGPVIAVIRES